MNQRTTPDNPLGNDHYPDSSDDTRDVETLEADIARTREELARTVDQLAAKLDVKARAKERVTLAKDKAAGRARLLRSRATTEDSRPRPAALAGAGGLVAGFAAVVIVVLWRRSVRTRTLPRSARMATAAQARARAAAATAAAAQEQARTVLDNVEAARSAPRAADRGTPS